MKKKLLSLVITMVFLLNVAAPAFADSSPVSTTSTATTGQTVSVTGSEATTTVDAGILPDSPVYLLDTLLEKLILIFTFSPEKKAQKLLANANERLEEAKVMTDEGKQELATESAEAYVSTVEKAQVQITIAINEGTLSNTVDSTVYGTVYNKKGSSVVAIVYGLDISQKHAAEVLIRVLAKSPEAARKGLINALQNVLKHQADQDGVIAILINGKDEKEKDGREKQVTEAALLKVVGNQDTLNKLTAQGFDAREITAIMYLAKTANKSVDEIAKLYLDQNKDLGAVIKALGLNVETSAKEIKDNFNSTRDQIKVLLLVNTDKDKHEDKDIHQEKDKAQDKAKQQNKHEDKVSKDKKDKSNNKKSEHDDQKDNNQKDDDQER